MNPKMKSHLAYFFRKAEHCTSLCGDLNRGGFETECCPGPARFFEALEETARDAVILDDIDPARPEHVPRSSQDGHLMPLHIQLEHIDVTDPIVTAVLIHCTKRDCFLADRWSLGIEPAIVEAGQCGCVRRTVQSSASRLITERHLIDSDARILELSPEFMG